MYTYWLDSCRVPRKYKIPMQGTKWLSQRGLYKTALRPQLLYRVLESLREGGIFLAMPRLYHKTIISYNLDSLDKTILTRLSTLARPSRLLKVHLASKATKDRKTFTSKTNISPWPCLLIPLQNIPVSKTVSIPPLMNAHIPTSTQRLVYYC